MAFVVHFSPFDGRWVSSPNPKKKTWEKIFKELLKKFNFITMATRVFDGIKFCEQFLKRTSCGTFLPSLVQIGPAVWEEMFKEIVDDARRMTDTSPP